jgi:hypothetical protein
MRYRVEKTGHCPRTVWFNIEEKDYEELKKLYTEGVWYYYAYSLQAVFYPRPNDTVKLV